MLTTRRAGLGLLAALIAMAWAAAGAARASADVTAPVITRAVTGTAGVNGWFAGPVNVHWSVVDPESPWTTSGCDAVTISGETAGVPLQCTASSGGGTSIDAFVVRIDMTPPRITGVLHSRLPDRHGWYRAPVQIGFTATDALSGVQGCLAPIYAGPDRRRARVVGRCSDMANNQSRVRRVRLRYDATGPHRIRAHPRRPPDRAGWYTHPVVFRFSAHDRVSGHAHCAAVTYGGPDGRGAVRATCSDRAGNVSVRDFRIRYDATAPRARLRVLGGDRMALVHWRGSRDVRSFTVTRWLTGAPWTARVVAHRGRRHRRATDTGLADGHRYTYRLVAVDRAGHRVARTRTVRAHRGLLGPRRHATVTTPPLLRWTPVAHARYYNVQLLRDGVRVLAAWPSGPRYRLPPSWTWQGAPQALVPGTYQWVVYPGRGPRARERYGRLIGQRTFVVPGAGGA